MQVGRPPAGATPMWRMVLVRREREDQDVVAGDGRIARTFVVVDGKPHGRWVASRPDGWLREGSFVNGERHGEWVEIDSSGWRRNGPYANGKREGVWLIVGPSGSRREGPYVNGKRHGRWVSQVSDGRLEQEWVEGRKDGITVLIQDGKVIPGQVYEKGEEVGMSFDIAEDPHASPDLLAKLGKFSRVYMLLARNPATPSSTLAEIGAAASKSVNFDDGRDESINILARLARNPATPSSLLADFGRSEEVVIRIRAAENPSTPIATLFALSSDHHNSVRRGLARNEAAPAAILNELSRDSSSWVRATVANNPNTPSDVLRELQSDTDRVVQCAANGGVFWDCKVALEGE